MKIAQISSLHADAGGRAFDFLKITADDGQVGWSEFNQSFGGPGVSATIDALAPVLIGKDPRAFEAHVALMQALRRPAAGGMAQQAIGAIENGLLDDEYDYGNLCLLRLLGFSARELSDLGKTAEPAPGDTAALQKYRDQLDRRSYQLNAASVQLTEELRRVWRAVV